MDYNSYIELWMGVLLKDFLRYFIFAGIAYLIFWFFGSNRWSHRFIQKNYPQVKILWHEFKYSMLTVLIFSINGFLITALTRAGHTKIYTEVGQYGLVWLFLSMAIMILFHDFYFYWTHRMMHLKSVYRHVHKVHHQSTNPSPWAAHSFHPLEAIIQAIPFNILVALMPLHPIAIIFFMMHMIIRNVIGHLGYELFSKRFLKLKWLNWLTTSTHHNLHHKNFNANYGLYFSWWDNWMGTTDEGYNELFEDVTTRTKEDVVNKSMTGKATVLLLLCCIGLSTVTIAQSPAGKWLTRDEATGEPLAVIQIDSVESGVEGYIQEIILQPHNTLDPICTKCKGKKKGTKVIGMEILSGFKKEGKEWVSGNILDPSSGEIYKSKMWLTSTNKLYVRGYAGPFNLFYRTQTWIKTNPEEVGLEGIWQTIDDRTNHPRSLVEISIKNGIALGYVKKLFYLPDEGPDPVCLACDGKLKGSKIVGMKILWGFEYENSKWSGGQLMDPGNGKFYDGILWLLDPNKLKIRGYWGPFFRTQVWERIL